MDTREVEAARVEVTARRAEEEVHRAFLGRFDDLDGLAEAGRRYKAVLDDELAERREAVR